MLFNEDPKMLEKIHSCPGSIREDILALRQLVIETARETEGIKLLEETRRWNEPSYLTKGGSTIRIGWNESDPSRYGLYFHCGTTLVETFKELYSDRLVFQGNRAIVFRTDDHLPVDALKHCISLALRYHHLKHLPLLGA